MNAESITVVVVSKNLAPLLRLALHHLWPALRYQRDATGDRVVVVDNASTHGYEPASFGPQVSRWLRYETHHSFAAACNAGMRASPNSFYLLLNNDVVLDEAALDAMLRIMLAEPRVGICGARLVYPDGTIQHAGMKMGPMATGPYHWKKKAPSEEVPRNRTEFQAVTGACMLIRHEVVTELGGLDETYPFAWEDVDFCLRARQGGWRVLCAQEVESIHFESMTPGRMEMDPPSQEVFRRRWEGKWTVDE